MSNEEPWHLSKGVPVTFIFAIILQTIALIWFVATLRNDVDNNSRAIMRAEIRIEAMEDVVQNQAVMMARIDENLKAIRDAIEREARSN